MNTDDLLIKYLLGEAGPAERAEIEQTLAADERKKDRLRQFIAIRELSDRTVPPAPDWREAYGRWRLGLQRRSPADTQHREEPRPVQRPAHRFSALWGIAAFLAGILFLGPVLFIHRKREPKMVPGLVEPAGITVSKLGPVVLPDGTVVKLGVNTTISYAFEQQTPNRTVYLNGEAFFSIVPDVSKPFIIHVRDLTIKVLGTSFAVHEEGGVTVIEMATGAVEVCKGRARRVIKAGDTLKASRDSDTLLVSSIRIDTAPKNHKASAVREEVVPPVRVPVSSPDTVIRPDDQLETVRSIIKELIDEKIVSDKEKIDWFGLDNGQFILNDKHLPDSVLFKFRSKFVRHGLGYYYGPVKVTGAGYFFTKEELNDH